MESPLLFYQFSMTQVLESGAYDGDLTIGEVKKHGDFGLGTFNGFDGEMVAIDGEFFKIRADGTAQPVSPGREVPFASMLFFNPSTTYEIGPVSSAEQLWTVLAGYLDATRVHAIRIDGEFRWAKTRSVPKQSKPYPSIEEIDKQRTNLERRFVQGSLVGFRCPECMRGLNVPGYHLHFIDQARSWGGHLLDCSAERLIVRTASTRDVYVQLP